MLSIRFTNVCVYFVGNLLVLSMVLYSLNSCISKVISFRMLFAMQFWDQAGMYVMMRPLFYRYPWEARPTALEVRFVRLVGWYYGLVLLRDCCEPFDRCCDALSAILRKVVQWLLRCVTSPIKVMGLIVAIALCGGPKAFYRGVCVVLLLAGAAARHPMVMLELVVRLLLGRWCP